LEERSSLRLVPCVCRSTQTQGSLVVSQGAGLTREAFQEASEHLPQLGYHQSGGGSAGRGGPDLIRAH